MKKLLLFILLITIQLQAQNPAFRFAWLSDTHVGSSTGEEDLRSSIADINENINVDFTIISGDITESGKTSDLKIAKDILDKLNKPYYIIPGNHDTKWSESGAAAFPGLWGHDRFVFRYRDFVFLGMHEGPVLRMADGHFAPEDLRWLDSEIGKFKGTSQKVIFVTHYPLDDQIDNWFEVIRRLKEINTQMVLVGHGHANRVQNYEGIHGIMGRSNLRAGKQTGGYNIVEIRNDSAFFSERIPKAETKPFWTSLSFSKKYDPVDTVKHPVPDFSVNKQFPFVREKWKFDTGYLVTASPVVSGNTVVAGNSNGDIYGLDITSGKTLWKYNAGSPVYSPVAAERNYIVAAAANGNVICLNSTDGKPLWIKKTPGPLVAAPVIKEGTIYLGSSEGVFRAMNISDGNIAWEYKDVKGFIETKPLITPDKVIFGAWDNYLYALNRKDGSLVWKWSNGRSEILLSPAACWPVASDGKVFVAAPDRYLTALDINSGRPVWRTNKFLVRECVGISEDQATVYSKCMRDTVFSFKGASNELEAKWVRNTGFGYDIAPSMLIEKEGNLFFSTKNGFIYSLNASDGGTKWVHRSGTGLINTLLPISADKVLVTSMDGFIILLENGKD